MDQIKKNARFAFDILKSPRIQISLFGTELARRRHGIFTAPHGLMPLIGKKYFGAALVDLADESAASLRTLGYARRRYNRSVKSGHAFREFDATRHIDELMKVNNSSRIRQGRSLTESYTDEEKVRTMAREQTPSFGVFSANDELLAYTHAPIIGDAFFYSRILGHDAHLGSGTMFRLVIDTNEWMRKYHFANGYPRWAFYDMFLGASDGLKFFKEKTGSRPYRVVWHWDEKR